MEKRYEEAMKILQAERVDNQSLAYWARRIDTSVLKEIAVMIREINGTSGFDGTRATMIAALQLIMETK